MVNINSLPPPKKKLFGSFIIFKGVKDPETKRLRTAALALMLKLFQSLYLFSGYKTLFAPTTFFKTQQKELPMLSVHCILGISSMLYNVLTNLILWNKPRKWVLLLHPFYNEETREQRHDNVSWITQLVNERTGIGTQAVLLYRQHS